jgi:pectate lyase
MKWNFKSILILTIITLTAAFLVLTCEGNNNNDDNQIGKNPDNGNGGDIIEPPNGGTNTKGDVIIIESNGWLETLFVKWEKLTDAVSYNVYYKGENISAWTKIDDPLIREYGTYFRADILGLKAGTYDVKVHYVNNSGIEGTDPAISTGIQVMAHRRYGFAFLNGAVPGAYNMDGTPKTGARIIYITEKTKETVSLGIRRNNVTTDVMFTGLQNIIGAYEAGFESRPLIVRFVGLITEKKNSPFTDNEGTVNIKGNSNTGRENNINGMNITFEGVGNDTVAHGWGFRSNRANNIEIRNLGFMLANTNQKDAVELQNSRNIWVHNNDFFYMRPGSASDQGKGDGSLDIKTCDLITISFNHFWDSGKSSLLGNNASESVGRFTYHHNWFNYSDSRHPRVRVHTVHIFNNLYDGIAKYGIGATLGSSILAERNYFRNSRKPILISRQGSDIMSGPNAAPGSSSGTFSSENGGMIKAFENFMDAYSSQEYRPWSPTNTVEFDAYEVSSASEIIPTSITAKQGGAIYNNFDTMSAFYSYTSDAPAIAMLNVETWAGRYWRGDFTFTFNSATDRPLADDPMPTLLAALNAYTSNLVRIQGE